MNTNERNAVVAGLGVVDQLVDAVSPDVPHREIFVPITKAALELAKGLVNAGHTDPAAELQRLRNSIEGAWQEALDAKFRQT